MKKGLPSIMTSRERLLALDGWPLVATVTVEITSKWYGLWLVEPLGSSSSSSVHRSPSDEKRSTENEQRFRLTELDFGVLETYRCPGSGSYVVDHVPNPNAVRLYCADKGYELDDIGFELIVGRWETEVEGRFA